MTRAEQNARRTAINDATCRLREGDPAGIVEMEGYLQAQGFGSLDDHWDNDGDSIYACFNETFRLNGSPPIQVNFLQGTDPKIVARVLRKMAQMLEGQAGSQIANLGLLQDSTDYARWLGNGVVGAANFRKQYAELQQKKEREGKKGED